MTKESGYWIDHHRKIVLNRQTAHAPMKTWHRHRQLNHFWVRINKKKNVNFCRCPQEGCLFENEDKIDLAWHWHVLLEHQTYFQKRESFTFKSRIRIVVRKIEMRIE